MSLRAVRNVRWISALLALGLVAGLAAGQQKKVEKKVRVSVVVILASEGDEKVDKKLECIAREVKKMQPKLKSFQLAKLSCKSVSVGTTDKFELVDNQLVSITVQRAGDPCNRVRLKVAPPKMGEITYSTPCGKFLPIVTRFRTAKNELLIIAVRVQPCPGK
jgi:hypothetical protein